MPSFDSKERSAYLQGQLASNAADSSRDSACAGQYYTPSTSAIAEKSEGSSNHPDEIDELAARRMMSPRASADPCPPDTKRDVIDFSAKREAWNNKPPGAELNDYRSLRHLFSKDFPPIQWVVEDYLPPGLAVLAGPPKAGKSTLALDISLATSRGGAACGGLVCRKGRTFYLALEDSERRLKQRIGEMWPEQQELSILWDYTLKAQPMPMFQEYLIQSLKDRPDTRLVIIDTWGVIGEDKGAKSSYKSDYAEAHHLQAIALEFNVCVLLLHHFRKYMTEDPFADISGTNGLIGAADTLWALRPTPGAPEAVLHIKGRDVEHQQLSLRFENRRWFYQGPVTVTKHTKEEQEIIAAIRGHEFGLTAQQIASKLDLENATVRKRLSRMQGRGLLKPGIDKHWLIVEG